MIVGIQDRIKKEKRLTLLCMQEKNTLNNITWSKNRCKIIWYFKKIRCW